MGCETIDEHTGNRVVAFIDILGTSETLKNGSSQEINNYIQGIHGLYTEIREEFPLGNLKMFSDNILIYTEGVRSDDIESLVRSVAEIQLTMVMDYGFFVRGGIVIGTLSHIPIDPDDFIVGKAVVEAHEIESKLAIYPRVVVSEEVIERYRPGEQPFIKCDWDQPFIDYLQSVVVDGFVDVDRLSKYRDSLIDHIHKNNESKENNADRWDRIRNKDLWTLSYYNDFCRIQDVSELSVAFVERYEKEKQKIIISMTDTEPEGSLDDR